MLKELDLTLKAIGRLALGCWKSMLMIRRRWLSTGRMVSVPGLTLEWKLAPRTGDR